jgi:hypothetical protein
MHKEISVFMNTFLVYTVPAAVFSLKKNSSLSRLVEKTVFGNKVFSLDKYGAFLFKN